MTYPRDVDLETPEADAAEQWADAYPGDDSRTPGPLEVDVETPEWDAHEQSEIVPDDDEYR